MKRICRLASIAVFSAMTLTWSGGCSRDECAVLRGSEVLYRARRLDKDAVDRHVVSVLLYVELGTGQAREDVHRYGWYVSDAQMSRMFELLGKEMSP